MSPEPCPPRAALERQASGQTGDASVARHLDTCDDCSRLVESIRADNDLLGGFARLGPDAAGTSGDLPVAPPGYRVIGEIHRGGQGVVYRAEQVTTRRIVALKMLLQGTFATTRQRQRFMREAELAASLKHPNVVTVYESGVTADGRHYLAMEYVEGTPLDTLDHDADDETRLRCFAEVCEAVCYAHRHGIIHRDLKPANILIDADGAPHVLDFGLAKDTLQETPDESVVTTRAGEFVGTFAYAAPEQVGGNVEAVDTRADVYALGVILYEMLLGRRPYDVFGPLAHVVRTILETPPTPPHTIRPDLDPDVETVLATALRKDPDRRYRSAQALLDDVRHVLRGEPIAARRDDTWYVLRKLVARHRVAFTVAALMLAALVAFTVVTAVLYRQATIAEKEMRATVASFVELLGSIDPENAASGDPARSVEELLVKAEPIVDELTDMPEVEAELRNAIGTVMLNTDLDGAATHLMRAMTLRESLFDPPHVAIGQSLHNLGRYHWKADEFETAESFYLRALAMRVELFGPDHLDVAETKQHLASTWRNLDRLEEALRYYLEAVRVKRQLLGSGDERVADALNGLIGCYVDMGRMDDARAALAEADQILARSDPLDWRRGRLQHTSATWSLESGDFSGARSALRRSIEIKRQVEPGSRTLANSLELLARVEIADPAGDLTAAIRYLDEVIAIRRRHFPNGHPNLTQAEGLRDAVGNAGTDADADADTDADTDTDTGYDRSQVSGMDAAVIDSFPRS